MKNEFAPDPCRIFPCKSSQTLTYIKPTVKNPRIEVGEYSYYDGTDFESRVTHFYDFLGDRLVIGKFCQIGAGVEFIMNGANHRMNTVTTYPFYIMDGWQQDPPPLSELPLRGDTVVGNDVWIGQNVTVLPGVHIGDGAIIGANSTVASDVPPYTVAVGNPARPVHRRFDDELIGLLERLRWWDLPTEEIAALLPLLSSSDPVAVKRGIRDYLDK